MNLTMTWFLVQQVPDAADISARTVDDMSLEVSVSFSSLLIIRSDYMDCPFFAINRRELVVVIP